MRIKTFRNGTTREVRKFALFPIRVSPTEYVLFEFYTAVQMYRTNRYPHWGTIEVKTIEPVKDR